MSGTIAVQGSVERAERIQVADPADFGVEDAPGPRILRRIRPKNAPPQDAVVLTVFQGARERPPAYPTDLPFTADVEVSVTEQATGARALQWRVEQPEPGRRFLSWFRRT